MERIVDVIRRLDESGEPYVQVTVVRRVRPSSAMVGDRAIVTSHGEMIGFVGGQCTKGLVVDQAQQCLNTGESRLVLVTAHPPAEPLEGVIVLPMTCHSEGTVELFLEPKLLNPVLLIIGDSPIAQALEQLAGFAGLQPCRVALENTQSDTEPRALSHRLHSAWSQHLGQPSFVVVATMGLYDVDAALALAESPLHYLGMVTSPRRWKVLQSELTEAGASEQFCAFISAPAGLDIGAQGPHEIALSILTQIISRRRRPPETVWQGLTTRHETKVNTEMTEISRGDHTVIDPVCGMSVDLSRTAHKLTHEGVEYGFCCAGCRDRFAKNLQIEIP